MKIAVIGAGALGGTFAVLLERAGHEVTVTARGATLATIRAAGIRLEGGFGEAHGTPTATTQLEAASGPFELALVCTKAQDAESAIAQNAAVLAGVPIVVVQNGLDGVHTAERLVPSSECFGLLSIIAANYTEPGRVRITTTAASYLGRGSGAVDEATLRIREILNSAVPVVTIANFEGAQWTKLVVNMVNALPAIVDRSVQQTIAHPGLRRVMTASMRETVRTGAAAGVRFGALQGLSNGRLRFFAALPLWAAQLLPLLFRARMGAVPNLGSTQQSLKRAQLTEVDFLNGAVVRRAAELGLTTPVNAEITRLLHEVERSGTPMTPEAVLRHFRALPRE